MASTELTLTVNVEMDETLRRMREAFDGMGRALGVSMQEVSTASALNSLGASIAEAEVAIYREQLEGQWESLTSAIARDRVISFEYSAQDRFDFAKAIVLRTPVQEQQPVALLGRGLALAGLKASDL